MTIRQPVFFIILLVLFASIFTTMAVKAQAPSRLAENLAKLDGVWVSDGAATVALHKGHDALTPEEREWEEKIAGSYDMTFDIAAGTFAHNLLRRPIPFSVIFESDDRLIIQGRFGTLRLTFREDGSLELLIMEEGASLESERGTKTIYRRVPDGPNPQPALARLPGKWFSDGAATVGLNKKADSMDLEDRKVLEGYYTDYMLFFDTVAGTVEYRRWSSILYKSEPFDVVAENGDSLIIRNKYGELKLTFQKDAGLEVFLMDEGALPPFKVGEKILFYRDRW